MILDLIALDPSSRVWVYPANRFLTYDELDIARARLYPFLSSWVAHDKALYTYGNVFHRRFLVLFVDETQASAASGCSIDASVRFVKDLGADLGVDFFDRMTYHYLIDEEIYEVRHGALDDAYSSGMVEDSTLFFDPLVKTKEDFIKRWIKPLKDSWQSKFIGN